MQYKRKRQRKTDYQKRLSLIKSEKTRLVIRRSNKNILIQFVQYKQDGDAVLLTVSTQNLVKLGWKTARRNTPAAYLAGLLAGQKAKQKDIKAAILDIGLFQSVNGNVLYAALKGVIDAGVTVPHDADVFPSEERIKGSHLKNCPFDAVQSTIQKEVKQ